MRTRGSRSLPNYAVGLIMVVVLAIASYVAFTKEVPWGGGNEYKVVFNSAQNLRPNSPVRIAGVEVGTITNVEPINTDSDDDLDAAGPAGALVTMEINDEGMPLKEDALFKLRPRLFLEGNLFLDLQPGSPSSPAVDAGYTFPPAQTSNTVQLDQILTASFQADARRNLQIFLDQFGEALIDEGGARSLRALNAASPDAFKFTSQVNQALLGENPRDLSNLIVNLDRVINGLNANEAALQGLVTNLRVTTGSFAAQDEQLALAIEEIPGLLDAADPAFASLNEAFPPLRAFAREALPGVESSEETLIAATPLLRQLRELSTPRELRGLVADLRPTVPNLARLTRTTIPFLEQGRALASCFNNTILPFANDRVDGGAAYNSQHGPEGRVFEETGYGLAGISGESRSGDANGQYIRVIGGGGANTVETSTENGETLAGLTQFPLDGAMPPINASAKTPFKPNAPCENQDPPDLRVAEAGPPPEQSTVAAGATPTEGEAGEVTADATESLELLGEAALAEDEGDEKVAERTQEQAIRKLKQFYARYGS